MMWHLRQVAITFLLIFASASLHARSPKVTSPVQSFNRTADARFTEERSCQDFLAAWGQKPEPLQFIDCQKISTLQGDRLVASYTVKGADAIAVEAVLQHKFRMAPLQFVEGTWQPVIANEKGQFRPASGEFVADDGRLFEVVMTSEKTPLSNRQDWREIDRFKVNIIQYLEMARSESEQLNW